MNYWENLNWTKHSYKYTKNFLGQNKLSTKCSTLTDEDSPQLAASKINGKNFNTNLFKVLFLFIIWYQPRIVDKMWIKVPSPPKLTPLSSVDKLPPISLNRTKKKAHTVNLDVKVSSKTDIGSPGTKQNRGCQMRSLLS